jgi:isopenicillin-N N-acyltransferase-like protein
VTVFEAAGSRFEVGEVLGSRLRERAQALYGLRLASALKQAREEGKVEADEGALLEVARVALAVTEEEDPLSAEELHGLARGTGLPPDKVMALNGLTDLRDALSWWRGGELFGGCSVVVAQGDVTTTRRTLCGQTWDLSTDNGPFVVVVRRRPRGEPESMGLAVAGGLPFLGMNELGLSVGTTNLRTRDARPDGVVYVSLIDRALRCETSTQAADSLSGPRRAGGHSFWVVDAAGAALALECTARSSTESWVRRGFFVRTNHCLTPEFRSLDVDAAHPSTTTRLRRLTTLCSASRGSLDVGGLQRIFADRHDEPWSICRDDFEGTSTNAAAVMEPDARRMHVCVGLPGRTAWKLVSPWAGATG